MTRDKNHKIYDFIIIGSGMGGLVSSVILSKNGYKVLVLEKNHQIGGALQVFSRDKCIFDTGVHYIGGLDEGENLYYLFKYLGIYDHLKLKRMDDDSYDRIRFPDGSVYAHGQGYENFIHQLGKSFPDHIDEIKLFCEKVQELCAFFPLYNIQNYAAQAYYNNPEILSLSAWKVVNTITQNKKLVNALLGSGPLYAGDAKTTPMYVVALIMNSYIKGSYRLADGGSQIARQLVKRLRENGGEILKHKEVVSAQYHENGEVKSVVCKDGTAYIADKFISNIHPSITINAFGKDRFRPAYRNRVNKLKNSTSTFMAYFSLKKNSFPYLNYNYYDYFTDDIWNITDYDESGWPQFIFTCTPASTKSEQYAESICAMCYMSIDEVEKWEQTFNTISDKNKRGEAYEQFKAQKIESLLKKLEERFPDIRACIKNAYSSTPLTYRDYIASPEGSIYGILKDFNNPIGTIINPKTKIPNLYLTGQNIIFHGILGTTIAAFVTSFNFIDPVRLVKDIKATGDGGVRV